MNLRAAHSSGAEKLSSLAATDATVAAVAGADEDKEEIENGRRKLSVKYVATVVIMAAYFGVASVILAGFLNIR